MSAPSKEHPLECAPLKKRWKFNEPSGGLFRRNAVLPHLSSFEISFTNGYVDLVDSNLKF